MTSIPVDLVLLGLSLWVPVIIIPTGLAIAILSRGKRVSAKH